MSEGTTNTRRFITREQFHVINAMGATISQHDTAEAAAAAFAIVPKHHVIDRLNGGRTAMVHDTAADASKACDNLNEIKHAPPTSTPPADA